MPRMALSSGFGVRLRLDIHVDTLRAVFHRYRQPCREDRGRHSSSGQPVDDADRAQLHRPGRWLPSRETIFDTRPRYEGTFLAKLDPRIDCLRGEVLSDLVTR